MAYNNSCRGKRPIKIVTETGYEFFVNGRSNFEAGFDASNTIRAIDWNPLRGVNIATIIDNGYQPKEKKSRGKNTKRIVAARLAPIRRQLFRL